MARTVPGGPVFQPPPYQPPPYHPPPYGQAYPPQAPVQHPFASYPYAPRPNVDPGYVGPQWAAPAPPLPMGYARPPKKKSSALRTGCLLVLGLLFALGAITLAAIIFVIGSFQAAVAKLNDPAPAAKGAVPMATVNRPAAPIETKTYSQGQCRDVSTERDRGMYVALRKHGSASVLRGKVAMLHVRLGGGDAVWTNDLITKVDESAILAKRFYLDQAKRYGVNDLTVDLIPWPLTRAPVDIPPLQVNSSDMLDEPTMEKLHDNSRRAIETAFGSPLPSVVTSYKNAGYDNVAFLAYLPSSTLARDFAFSSVRSPTSGDPELAVVFPRLDNLPHLSVTVAHEAMHLFGAADIYRMQPEDPHDKDDVMGDYCLGFHQTTVDDVTAYAIGWTDTKPTRVYQIMEE
jgi:hypothetical protein